MKFIWSPLEKASLQDTYPKTFWELPIVGWLQYNDVWFSYPDKQSATFDYNYLYNFFDISIFETRGYGKGPPRKAIEKMNFYLKNSGLKYQTMYTWVWVGKEKIDGVRFLIDAEEVLKSKHERKELYSRLMKEEIMSRRNEV